MRIVGSVSLATAATLIGLFGTLMLGAAGLSLTGPGLSWAGPGVTVIEYSDSDDTERAIGIGMGIIALAVWLVLLLVCLNCGAARRPPDARAARTVWSVVVLSMVLVLGMLIAVLATPPPLY